MKSKGWWWRDKLVVRLSDWNGDIKYSSYHTPVDEGVALLADL